MHVQHNDAGWYISITAYTIHMQFCNMLPAIIHELAISVCNYEVKTECEANHLPLSMSKAYINYYYY